MNVTSKRRPSLRWGSLNALPVRHAEDAIRPGIKHASNHVPLLAAVIWFAVFTLTSVCIMCMSLKTCRPEGKMHGYALRETVPEIRIRSPHATKDYTSPKTERIN